MTAVVEVEDPAERALMDRRRLAIFSAIVIGAMVVLSAWAWLQLPADAQVPIHWGPSGEPDGWAGKTIGLFLMPLVTIGIAALLWAIPSIEPRRANLEKSGRAYGAIWIALILLLAVINAVIVAAAVGAEAI
jgi:uncharacterized membrane protein